VRKGQRYDRKLWIGDFLLSVVYLPFEQSKRKADAPTSAKGRGTPMGSIHEVGGDREQFMLDLDEMARQGARRMLAEALEAEVEAYLEAARGQRDERGHALVVRNGHASKSKVLLGAGAIEVRAPRVNDKRLDEGGQRRSFKSVVLPPYMRKSPKVSEVLPLLYVHALSSGDFVPALEEFFGSEAGLWAKSVQRLAEQWRQEREGFMWRELSERDYL
jgi:putative transposase